ncbi:MAG: TlpA family protein disulfide reductase [Thermoplasmata archaeon]
MAEMRECPICGIRVKLENLELHLKRVHPRAKVELFLTEEDKTALKIVRKKRKEGMKPFEERERKRWILAGVVVVVVIVVVVVMLSLVPPTLTQCDLKGRPPPPIDIGDVEGNPYSLYDHVGEKPILIEFFSTKCPYCKDMAPNMNTLYAYYGYGQDVEFVSISAYNDDSIQLVKNFKDYEGSNWTFIWDSSFSLDDDYCAYRTPIFYIVGKDGTIREIVEGYQEVGAMIAILDRYV